MSGFNGLTPVVALCGAAIGVACIFVAAIGSYGNMSNGLLLTILAPGPLVLLVSAAYILAERGKVGERPQVDPSSFNLKVFTVAFSLGAGTFYLAAA